VSSKILQTLSVLVIISCTVLNNCQFRQELKNIQFNKVLLIVIVYHYTVDMSTVSSAQKSAFLIRHKTPSFSAHVNAKHGLRHVDNSKLVKKKVLPRNLNFLYFLHFHTTFSILTHNFMCAKCYFIQ